MISRRKEFVTIVAPKAILQENITRKKRFEEQIQRFFTRSHNKQNCFCDCFIYFFSL
jgi:hypothetical protein